MKDRRRQDEKGYVIKIVEELKMVPLFSLFMLFLKTLCVCSWLAGNACSTVMWKSFLLPQPVLEKQTLLSAIMSLTIKEDLHGLPSNLLNLCIQMEEGYHGTLAPDSFSALFLWKTLQLLDVFQRSLRRLLMD